MKINATFNTSSWAFQIVFTICLMVFAAALFGTIVYSWDGPSSSPPNGNVSAPINTGSASQAKSGPLQVDGFLNTGSSVFQNDVHIDGGDLRLDNAFYNQIHIVSDNYWSGIEIRTLEQSRNGNPHIDFTHGDSSTNFGVRLYAPTNNRLTLSGGHLDVNGNVYGNAFYYSSDASLKEDVEQIDDASSILHALDGVSFTWKDSGEKSVGLVAQEVEEVLPELVNTDPETGLKSVQYANLVAPLIEAVKEQEREIDSLQKQIDTLQTQVDALQE